MLSLLVLPLMFSIQAALAVDEHGEIFEKHAPPPGGGDCSQTVSMTFHGGSGDGGSGDALDTEDTARYTCEVCVHNGQVTRANNCYYDRVEGCFAKGTQILMSDGSTRSIEQLRAGDMIWNPILGHPTKVGRMVAGPEKEPLLEIKGDGRSILVTKTHPMLIRASESAPGLVKASLDKSTKKRALTVTRADQLKAGQEAMDRSGKFFRIESVTPKPETAGTMVYNFEVVTDSNRPEDHAVVANGVVTGDVVTQYKLNGARPDWE